MVSKIINTHIHVFKKHPGYGYDRFTLEDLEEDMRKGGVSKCLILAEDINEEDYKFEELFDKIKDDKRFEVIYTLDLWSKNLKDQVKIVEEYFKKDLIKGIKILLGYGSIMPNDKLLEPFYDLCEKYDYPALFHTGDTLNAFKLAKLKYSHPLNIDELAVDRPNLKIVMAHIGFPWIIDAAEVIYKNKNVYGDISGFFEGDFDDKRFYNFIKNKMNEFLGIAGGKKLLFGTDFPLENSSNYIKFVKDLDLTKEELEFLFHKNAENLFKLK